MGNTKNMQYACTDLGNVERFIDQHQHHLKATGNKSAWLVWDGCRWKHCNERKAHAFAVETVKSISKEAEASRSSRRYEELRKWAKQSQSEARISSLLSAASKSDELYVDPSQLDRDQFTINTQGGPVSLTGGQAEKLSSERLFTKTTSASWQDDAECPGFLEFIRSVFNNDDELIEWVQRAIGYSLSARVTEQVLFIAYGTGANGKSTLFELLHMILGDYSKMADFETFVTGKKSDVRTMEAIGELKGIRFALASEIDSSKRFDEALIKKLTGGDTLRGTALRSSAFQFSPEFKIWLLTNHLPFARDGSHGFWRRIKVIPFKQTFRGDDMQSNLLGRLSTERNGILKWCVEGAAKYFHKVRHEETGLGPCKAIDDATAAYRYDNDTASRFIEEVVEAREGEQVQARALFSAYESWSFEEGIKYPISEQIFSRRMEERGFEKKRTSEATFYRGISLKKEFRGSF